MVSRSPSAGPLTVARHHDWLSGPNDGYGFGSSGPPHRSPEEHREHIRAFLSMIDPATGYIGDDSGGDP